MSTNHSKIITEKLENISNQIFKPMFRKEIKQILENKKGIYALYDKKDKLYYVGRASKLMKRVEDHLTDQHAGKWNRFSIYLTKKEQDIEDVVISIAEPKGNKQKPKFVPVAKTLKKDINEAIDKITKEIKVGKNKRSNSKTHLKSKSKNKQTKGKNQRLPLKNYFKKDTVLTAKYKGKNYEATWLKSLNKVIYNNILYNTLNGATKAIVKGQRNSLDFWKIKDSKNNWITLNDLKKTF